LWVKSLKTKDRPWPITAEVCKFEFLATYFKDSGAGVVTGVNVSQNVGTSTVFLPSDGTHWRSLDK